ncbi:AAA family ATPase [Allohahella marinimesophila]|uniref:AAA family ATPase n=1 Tax=Allohahella marinimesophila TaxID=1054972 RepID=A0ABP7NHY1_9GAMM
MKLLRLSLENWRGVVVRNIDFSDGVTLIEGPNEIGKSTLIEALRTLFAELDSSNKKSVKAIQPVGEDVGSRVEAEVVTGQYHFVYAKTYNRKAQTTLRILKPEPAQLTGREAHERAELMLASTIDMSLWNALLVEQGKEIRGAGLSESAGLARALDEAVGSAASEQDDAGVFERVQAEYEQYFSLKTGKPRLAKLDNEVEVLESAVDQAKTALTEVITDTADHERCIAEIQRLESAGPELQGALAKRQAEWEAVSSIEQQGKAARADLATAQQLWEVVRDEELRRMRATEQCDQDLGALENKRREVTIFSSRLEQTRARNEAADLRLRELKGQLKEARSRLAIARADERYLDQLAELEREEQRQQQCLALSEQMAAERAVLNGISVNAERLDVLQEAERQLQLARGQRDLAATLVEVSALKDFTLEIDGEPLDVRSGALETRHALAALSITIPGLARLRIVPSQTSAELEEKFLEARANVTTALKRCGVDTLAEAFAADARRLQASHTLGTLSDRRKALLGDDDEAELEARVAQKRANCAQYVNERETEEALPGDLSQARLHVKRHDQKMREIEQALELAQSDHEAARADFEQVHADQRVASQAVEGLEADLQRRRAELSASELAESSESLRSRLQARAREKEAVEAKLRSLEKQLAECSVESVEALLLNARASCDRLQNELLEQVKRRAILDDRLEKAQADGRQERLDEAQRKLIELKRSVAAEKRRAAAAKRLWECINQHRDATRKAYLRPLKEGIEMLGRIVFGADFEIALADDWSLSSCTRNGRTIPFEALSVGAKEQLGILTRLAAAKIVSRHGGVPVIIDDALGFSDPSRLETMGAALAYCGAHSQIILLTCTPGRFSYVGNAERVRL